MASKRLWKNILRLILIIVAVVVVLIIFSDWIVELLWLDNLGYRDVFWTIKGTQVSLFIGALIVSLIYMIPNMNRLARNFRFMSFSHGPLAQLNLHAIRPHFKKIFLGLGILVCFIFSIAFFTQWDAFFRFFWNQPFSQVDPIFNNDLSFYIFRLPFIQVVQTSLTFLVFFITAAMIVLYLYSGEIRLTSQRKLNVPDSIKKQLFINIGIWLLLLSWGFYLDRYNILNSQSGVVYGAGYTDVNFILPATWIVCIMCFLLALLAFFQLYRKQIKWLVLSGAATVGVGIIGLVILPAAIQNFVVQPNELQLEKPFIENNIKLTRSAYALNKMKERRYSPNDSLTWEQLQNNESVIKNVRLWDQRLLIETYRQLQEIRLY
ncbi:MAG TPA: UPF0182 family protein, partial [Balneolaceae bacterium]|nr:UPF0182 family protein [Balneolaceae bacterium]